MKILVIALGLGCFQFMINQVTGCIEPPIRGKKVNEIVMTDSRWECSRCGNDNGDWTSICGKCGRSR